MCVVVVWGIEWEKYNLQLQLVAMGVWKFNDVENDL